MTNVERDRLQGAKLLVVSQYFAPDITAAAFRVADMTARLANRGLRLTVLTAHPHKAHVESEAYKEREDVTIRRSRVIPIGSGGILRYLAHYASFVAGSIFNGIRLFLTRRRYDFIWVSSPPLFAGVSGLLLSKVFRCPLVFEVRDIWPDTAVAAGQISAEGTAYKVGAALESLLYRKAEHIVCVSRPMAEYVRSKTESPVSVIYNGVDGTAQIPPISDHADAGVRRIVYAGNLGHLQALDTLLEALAEAKASESLNGWQVLLVGTGAEESRLKEKASSGNLDGVVRFTGAVSREEAGSMMAAADLLYVGLKDHPVLSKTIPSKVFDCLMAAKPILASIGGEGAEILGLSGANVVCRPGSPRHLADALREAIEKLDELKACAGENKRLVMSRYTRDVAADGFADILTQIMHNQSDK